MLTADSVNMLKNVQEVELDGGKNKKSVPWKSVIKKQVLHNGGSTGSNVYKDG